MKRSKQVALLLTGSMAVTGCHQAPDGSWQWGSGPYTSGTNGYYNYSHGGYGHWSGGGWGGGEEEGGVERGGFGFHGGFGGE